MADNKNDVRVHIVQKLGSFGETVNGWTRWLCLVQWNGNPAKYDIRSWNEDFSRCSKGLTFDGQEFDKLAEIINDALGCEA